MEYILLFQTYTAADQPADDQAEAITVLGTYIQPHVGSVYLYMVGPPFMGFGSLRYLADGVQGTNILDPNLPLDQFPPTPPGRTPLFVLAPERTTLLDAIEQKLTGGIHTTWYARREPSRPIMRIYDPTASLTTTIADQIMPVLRMSPIGPLLISLLVCVLTFIYCFDSEKPLKILAEESSYEAT